MSVRVCGQLQRGAFDLDVDVAVDAGEVVAVLGPNGSGKTTLVNILAGLAGLDDGMVHGTEPVDPQGHSRTGEIIWDAPAQDRWTPPERRQVGLLLADPLLFPHLCCRDNVAFGLRARRVARAAARERADQELAAVGLTDHADRRPRQLSTGQAQRVALARALASDPGLLLLDEPLSALDPETRATTRIHLAQRLGSYSGSTLLVTHDPLDALTLADRLVFLDAGRVVQAGTPAEIVSRPRSAYVARIVGLNLWRARRDSPTTVRVLDERADPPSGQPIHVSQLPDTTDVWVTLRPSAVALWEQRPHGSPRNAWHLEVASVELASQSARVSLTGAIHLVAEVTPASVAELGLTPGRRVWASAKATEICAYEA